MIHIKILNVSATRKLNTTNLSYITYPNNKESSGYQILLLHVLVVRSNSANAWRASKGKDDFLRKSLNNSND